MLDADTRADLAHHRVVLLTVAPRVVAHRVRGSSRPLLDGEDPLTRWTRIYEERRPIYEQLADATFDTSNGPLQNVVERIVAWARPEHATPPAQSEESHDRRHDHFGER
nr:hypothetical protein GCM10025699_26850 [Microbacterium flavescens]